MNIKLSHDIMASYLRGLSDKKSRQIINSLRSEDRAYDMLFDLFNPYIGKNNAKNNFTVPCSFHIIEDDLYQIMAGKVNDDNVQAFIQKIISSRVYYERLVMKLTQILEVDDKSKIPELRDIVIKSEKQILYELGITNRHTVTVSEYLKAVRQWLTYPFPKPIPAYVSVLLMCIATGMGVVWFNNSQNNFDDNFVYDGQVPYEYDHTIMRNMNSDDTFIRQNEMAQKFLLGLSYYSSKKYHKASTVLEPLSSEADITTVSDPTIKRDIYFYTGLTQLALATSKKQPVKSDDRKQHITKALRSVKKAAVVAKELKLNPSRENYFMGICFYLAGQPDSALTKIASIPSDNPLYSKATQLKHQLIQSY